MGRLTEKKRVKIDHTCVQNPVYLNWLGTNTGRNYWLFRYVQFRSNVILVNGTFQPYTDDIEHAQGYIQETGRDDTPRLRIGALVPVEDLAGIKKMLRSINVLMLMNPDSWQTEGPRWQQVRPLPGTYEFEATTATHHSIEVTLELPFINIQAQ